ncbi:hypothetical protein THAOC_20642 [Thalassiosira oceanica]|uniref:Uncharacterized protein n=1 Tax=Thalassiosira oceanica TaxID=159749 RepID=K0S1U8_THAOC|nr:hypothetical protein THAOC_20642 [Thalassiosira oceanica]|eukprot:EJK59175.1 hypothetical protein THAOC_20642 [Thalassiosira oceanica]
MSPDRARRAALSCSHCSDHSDQAARMGLQLEDASKRAGGALTVLEVIKCMHRLRTTVPSECQDNAKSVEGLGNGVRFLLPTLVQRLANSLSHNRVHHDVEDLGG